MSLRRLAERGALRVRLTTEVDTRWRHIPVLTAELDGEEDNFVLFSGHIDYWHYGAMDNGTANATMMEVGRILANHRAALRRVAIGNVDRLRPPGDDLLASGAGA